MNSRQVWEKVLIPNMDSGVGSSITLAHPVSSIYNVK